MKSPLTLIRSPEAIVSFTVFLFVFMFAIWTLGQHAATFLDIPWRFLSGGFVVTLPVTLIVGSYAASHFSHDYGEQVRRGVAPLGEHGLPAIVFGLILLILLLAFQAYQAKYVIAVIGTGIGMAFVWSRDRGRANALVSTAVPRPEAETGPWVAWSALLIMVLIAVTLTLVVHRPATDDASFLQIPLQTMLYPDRAPLTFDASLGAVVETFRFAPYRLASYETAVTLITEWTGISLFTAYYMVVPGVTAALAVGVAFLFARWFLPAGPAILATAIFLLVMLAWGSGHRAYGNFMLVRLFEGKALLLVLATPMTIVAGLMVLGSPSVFRILALALLQVAAVGYSSSGLVVTVFTTGLLLLCGIRTTLKETAYLWSSILVTVLYPALLAFWLRFLNVSEVPLSGVGTYMPVDISLGSDLNTGLALFALAFGPLLLPSGREGREFRGLALGSVLIILNPWIADVVASLTARNMSWRLAWASPVPLLVSVSITAGLVAVFQKSVANGLIRSAFSGICLVALLLLLIPANWTLFDEEVEWRSPSAKLPRAYYVAERIGREIATAGIDGLVLAPEKVAAWLPIAEPRLELVMPGHSFPKMFATVMPPAEFDERMALFTAVNQKGRNLDGMIDSLRKYRVQVVIVPKSVSIEDVFPPAGTVDGAQVSEKHLKGRFKALMLYP